MSDAPVSTEQAQGLEVAELFGRLESSAEGLGSEEARRRLDRYGPNALEERKASALRQFLGYFWGPIPWMIEIAAVLSAIVQHWADLTIIAVLLLFNAAVGFFQQRQAANAVEALQRQLALKARVRRDGAWQEIDAKALVPGDVVRVRLGDVLPADVKLFEGDYLSVDQSALTGESLPAEKKVGDVAYSSSIARQGEMAALVVSTGGSTYFGKTAKMVASARSVSHFQKAVLSIGDYLIYLSLGLATVLVLTMLVRGAAALTLLQFALILVVAAIPVAMPAVLSVTMAIGSMALARMKAIVTRLESIEEMAGVDVLCSDKTGTLTENRLTLGEVSAFGAAAPDEVVLAGALASKAEDRDAIDTAVLGGLEGGPSRLEGYRQVRFTPFDPVHKRTEATVEPTAGGARFRVTKGAPQVVLGMCRLEPALAAQVGAKVEALARRGFRTLGVARAESDEGKAGWTFLGLLPLFDPPRQDSKATLANAKDHGIAVKMVTGDNLAIAEQISAQLGLGSHIRVADEVFGGVDAQDELPRGRALEVERAEGFAQVFPEHKFAIVKALQSRGHIVGMTGDGVNDAPALKQADAGIAVSGATDAARAAASLVLTAPGLSVIVRAVEEARRIFERMTSYAIYRITETIRIMVFVTLAMLVFRFYPITTVMIILLAVLNDLPILAIAYDNTWLDPSPIRWDMRRVLTVATGLGLIGVAETFGILVIARLVFRLGEAEVQSFIYLKLAVAGHLTLLVARTRGSFLKRPYPAPILLGAVVATQVVAALIVGLGLLVTPIGWRYIGFIWVYCLAWVFLEDLAKQHLYRHLALVGKRHRAFLGTVKGAMHPLGASARGGSR